jgi:hypothetical protein
VRFGSPAKRIAANPDAGQNFNEGLWADPEKYIKAVDRGNVLGMVYIEKAIQDNLSSHRKNKPQNLHAMDSDVASALKKPDPPPGPPAAEGKDKKKKKK